MQEILWEHTSNGLNASVKPKSQSSPSNLFRVMSVALKKMDAVRLISAKFSGQQVLFEPCVGVLFDFTSHADFLGIYNLSDERDILETPERILLPELCLRKVSWHQEEDITSYKNAENKRAYIWSEQAIDAKNLFISSAMYPELLQYTEALKDIICHGVAFDAIQREHPVWDTVRVGFSDGGIDMNFYYNLTIQTSPVLETWLMKWYNAFSHLDYSGGILPDGNFRISYQSSLFEMIDMFPA